MREGEGKGRAWSAFGIAIVLFSPARVWADEIDSDEKCAQYIGTPQDLTPKQVEERLVKDCSGCHNNVKKKDVIPQWNKAGNAPSEEVVAEDDPEGSEQLANNTGTEPKGVTKDPKTKVEKASVTKKGNEPKTKKAPAAPKKKPYNGYIVPGNPEQSEIYDKIKSGEMPLVGDSWNAAATCALKRYIKGFGLSPAEQAKILEKSKQAIKTGAAKAEDVMGSAAAFRPLMPSLFPGSETAGDKAILEMAGFLRSAGADSVPFTVSNLSGRPIAGPVRKLIDNFRDDPSVPRTIEGFVASLPEEYRTNYLFVPDSESLQTGFRVLTRSKDSKTVVTFNLTDPEIEMSHFNGRDWEFHSLKFNPAGLHLDASPAKCHKCHYGGDAAESWNTARPNWEAYDWWSKQLPAHRDRIYEGSLDEKRLRYLFADMAAHPLLKHLKLPTGIRVLPDGRDPQGRPKFRTEIDFKDNESVRYVDRDGRELTEPERQTHLAAGKQVIRQGGRFHLFLPGQNGSGDGQGVTFFDQSTALNAKRVAQDLALSPDFGKVKYVVRAIIDEKIRSAADFRKYLPPDVIARLDKHHGMSFDALMAETDKVRRSLPVLKAERLERSMKTIALYVAKREGRTLSPKELDEQVRAALLLRNARGDSLDVTKRLVDREQHHLNHVISGMRYVLEPFKVRVDRWSMSDVQLSKTYTFGDLWGQYQKELVRILPQDRHESTLMELSLHAFGTPYGPR